jgi:flagellar biosynthesis/type III secretory pathway chaperone
MKNLTTNITRVIIVGALFASSAVMAEQAEQPVTVTQLQNEVAKEITEVKASLVQDLQRQLTNSIKQQVHSAVNNIADSVKSLLP